MLTRRDLVQGSSVALAALAAGCATGRRRGDEVRYPRDSLNRDVMAVVDELRAAGETLRSANPDARYYRLPDAAFTEPLTYGGQAITAGNYYPATNCSTACFEAFVRTLNRVETRDGGVVEKLSYDDLTGRRGFPLRSWMMRSKTFESEIGAASPKFRSMVGPADGFVLYGIGDIVDFREAAPGDFVQFHRWTRGSGSSWNKYMQGHAVIFTGFLDAVRNDEGQMQVRPARGHNSETNCGFTYFSSNGPTNGLSHRYAFFYGKQPEGVIEDQPWDRNVQEPTSRDDLYALSIARLYQPSLWRRELTNVRIDAYRTGTSIYALESQNSLMAGREYDARFGDENVMLASADPGQLEAEDVALAAAFDTEPASFVPMYNMEE